MTDQLKAGGTERQFATLASVLAGDAFRLRLGCLQRTGAFAKEVGEIVEFNTGGSFLSVQAQRARLALGRYLRAQDIRIAHSFEFYSNLMMIPVAKWAGVPVVVGSLRQLGHRIGPFKLAVLGLVLNLCDRVVCNSEAAARVLREHGLSESKIVIIPNGVAVQAFEEAMAALPRNRDVLRVGLVARMNNPVKNHAGFLRAAALVSRRFPNTEFVLAGDGSLRPELEQLSRRLGLAGRAIFLGERRDVAGVLQSLDVSVVPSFSESLSNVILESMAAGKPVVASRVGGNPELVQEGHTGLLVLPQEEGQIAEAICTLLDQPRVREEWGKNAREVVRREFGIERMRERYVHLYRTLLEEKGCQAAKASGRPRAVKHERPHHVVIVAPSLRKLGGQSVQADLLLRNWQDDPEVSATFVPTDPEFPRGLAWVEAVPLLRTLVRMPFYWARLWRNLKGADIVHIFSASYWSFLIATTPALWIARRMRKETIINYRSGEAQDHLQNWRTAVPVLRRADRLVVPSGYLVEVFRDFGLRAEVVPNVVDLSQFTFRLRKPLRPRLICTRGFEPYYDVDLVVHAFAEVQKEFPEAELFLVGRGRLESEIRVLVAQLGLRNVEFTGWIAREQIGRCCDRADILVNASWLDNMPVSILEGFAAGTPVVTTSPPSIRFIVEHERTGLLCAPKDWQGLARNVLLVLRSPELAERLALNAFEESRRYRWESVRQQWLRVYAGATSIGGAPGIETKKGNTSVFVETQCNSRD